MPHHFRIDSLDRKILELLTLNARTSYLEVARKCKVSGAAIHQRVQKMTEAGIIAGSRVNISPAAIGYISCAFIGIQVNLTSQSTHELVYEKIKKIPEVVECHHISGKYSLLVKVFTKNNEHLKNVIVEKIQNIPEITSTETFISLQEGFTRQPPIQ